jgi:hypothetical protein
MYSGIHIKKTLKKDLLIRRLHDVLLHDKMYWIHFTVRGWRFTNIFPKLAGFMVNIAT